MKLFALVFLISLLQPAASMAAAGGPVTLLPENAKAVTITVGGNDRDYCILPPNNPLKLRVDGPGKLTVTSRVLFSDDAPDELRYSVCILEGDDTVKLHATRSERSDAVLKDSKLLPGKSRKFALLVPDGSHMYLFRSLGSPSGTALRLQYKAERGPGKLISIEPLSYDKIVTASINENLVAYYLASRSRPVQLRVVGPTKVRVSIRLNFDRTMQGRQKYSVNITGGSEKIAQWSLEASKAEDISYKEWKEIVPGKLSTGIFDVPAGEHTYTVSPGESTATSVSLRFSVPQADVGNEGNGE